MNSWEKFAAAFLVLSFPLGFGLYFIGEKVFA